MLRTVIVVASSLLITSSSTNFLPESYRARLLDALLDDSVDALIREELLSGVNAMLVDDPVSKVRIDFLKSIEWSELVGSEGVAALMNSKRHLMAHLNIKRNPFSIFSPEIKAAIRKYLKTKYEDCFMGRIPSGFMNETVTVRDLQIRKTSDSATQISSMFPDIEVLGVLPNEVVRELWYESGHLFRYYPREFVDLERRCSLRFSRDKDVHFLPEIRTLVARDEERLRDRKYLYTVYIGDHPAQSFYTGQFAKFWVGIDGHLRCRSQEYRSDRLNPLSSLDDRPEDIYLRVFSSSGVIIDTILLQDAVHDQVLFEHGYKFPSNALAEFFKLKNTAVRSDLYSDKVFIYGLGSDIILASGRRLIEGPFEEKFPSKALKRMLRQNWMTQYVDRLEEAAEVIFKPEQLAMLIENGGIYMTKTQSVYVSRFDAFKLKYVSGRVQVFVESKILEKIWQTDGLLGKISLNDFIEHSRKSRLELVGEMLLGKPEETKLFFNHVLKGRYLGRQTVFNDRKKALDILHIDTNKFYNIPSIADVPDIESLKRIVDSTPEQSAAAEQSAEDRDPLSYF